MGCLLRQRRQPGARFEAISAATSSREWGMGGLLGIRSSSRGAAEEEASWMPDGTVAGSRWNSLHSARGRCRRQPLRAPFSRPLPPSGSQPDPVARLPMHTCRRGLGNVETRGPEAKWAVKQRGAKLRESENPRTKSRAPLAQPSSKPPTVWDRRIALHVQGAYGILVVPNKQKRGCRRLPFFRFSNFEPEALSSTFSPPRLRMPVS